MGKQKHDPGMIKRKKNMLLNPEKLSRATKVARRIPNNASDYITAIEKDAANGLEYAMTPSQRSEWKRTHPPVKPKRSVLVLPFKGQ